MRRAGSSRLAHAVSQPEDRRRGAASAGRAISTSAASKAAAGRPGALELQVQLAQRRERSARARRADRVLCDPPHQPRRHAEPRGDRRRDRAPAPPARRRAARAAGSRPGRRRSRTGGSPSAEQPPRARGARPRRSPRARRSVSSSTAARATDRPRWPPTCAALDRAPGPAYSDSLLDLRRERAEVGRRTLDEQLDGAAGRMSCPRSRASRPTHSRQRRADSSRAGRRTRHRPARTPRQQRRRASSSRATRTGTPAARRPRSSRERRAPRRCSRSASARRITSTCAPPNSERRGEVVERGGETRPRPRRAHSVRQSRRRSDRAARAARASARSTRKVSSPCSR